MSEFMRDAELVIGGKTIKQGEIFELVFRLFDSQRVLVVPTVDQLIEIKIANDSGVVYETTAIVDDNKIKFTVSENIGWGRMRLEIKVSEGVTLINKYPSSGQIILNITQSLDDVGLGNVYAVTAQQMRSEITAIELTAGNALTKAEGAETLSLDTQTQLDAVILRETDTDAMSRQAAIDADGVDKVNLKSRLDDDYNKTTSSLAETLKQGEVSVADIDKNLGLLDQTYFTDETKQQWTGTTPVNATPANGSLTTVKHVDKSISPVKTNFMKVSSNLYNRKTALTGKGLDLTTGALNDNATRAASEIIHIKPNFQYIVSGTSVRWVLYDEAMTFISTDSTSGTAFTTPVNAIFMRLSIPIAQVDTVHVNEGGVLLEYEEFYNELKGVNVKGADIDKDSIDNSKLTRKSIKPINTTFVKISTNKFNKEKLNTSASADPTTGAIVPNATTDLSDFIPIEPSKIHTIYTYAGSYFLYDANKNFIANSYRSAGTSAVVFTTASNVGYLRMSVQKGTDTSVNRLSKDTAQLNEGGVLLPYELYDNAISDVRVRHDVTDFVEVGTNLFNKDTLITKTTINATNGIAEYNATISSSPFMEIKSNKVYTTNVWNTRVAFYDENKNFISVIATTTITLTFTTPINCKFIRMPVRETWEGKTQLNEGSALLRFENYHYKLKYSENIIGESNPYRFSPIEIIGELEITDTVEAIDGTGISGFNNATVMTQDIYNLYDALVTLYPNYITREQIGTDASNTFPIYCYTFNPIAIVQTPTIFAHKKFPKIILGTGLHGDGTSGDKYENIFSLYYLLKDICVNWQTQDLLEYLRYNVIIKIVPVQNPWGVNNRARKNFNGVDINRNFDTTTWASLDPTSQQYGGTAPFSEPETRALRDLVLANTDAVLVVDYHTTGGIPTDDKWIYFEMNAESELYHAAVNHIKKTGNKWKSRGYGLSDLEYYGYIYNGKAGKYQQWVFEKVGINACVIESAPDIFSNAIGQHRKDIMDMSYENYSNWIVNALKYIKEIK